VPAKPKAKPGPQPKPKPAPVNTWVVWLLMVVVRLGDKRLIRLMFSWLLVADKRLR
jgi:hypothetical protein